MNEKELAAAFTEWDRRFREEPDRFIREAESLKKHTPQTYGAAAAPYFLQIYRELYPMKTTAVAAPEEET